MHNYVIVYSTDPVSIYECQDYCSLQLEDGIIPFGSEMAVCVLCKHNCVDRLGVVCLDRLIHCVTCKYGTSSCQHVEYLLKSAAECLPEELSPHLQPFADFAKASTPYSKPTTKEKTGCASTLQIPFELPQTMKIVLKQDPSTRFCVSGDVAHLPPNALSSSCQLCGAMSWSEAFLVKEVALITTNRSFQAKGTYI